MSVMYSISDLQRASGFTENQIRDRLRLLLPIVGEDVQKGARGKILVGDRTLAALKRMAELEREGLSPKVAQGRILAELGQAHANGQNASADPWQRLLQEKDAQIAQLESERNRLLQDISWLKGQIEHLQGQLQALPQGKSTRLSRWQALKFALLGR